MRIVGYTDSEDQDIPCATCRRQVKKAVAFDDRPGLHGLDCAARILGKPARSKKALDDIELEGMKARAVNAGAAFGERARVRFGRLPSKKTFLNGGFSYKAYTDHTRGALAAVGGPLPEGFPFKDAYWEAFIDAFEGE